MIKQSNESGKLITQAAFLLMRHSANTFELLSSSFKIGYDAHKFTAYYLIPDELVKKLLLAEQDWFKSRTIRKAINKHDYWFVPCSLLNPILIKTMKKEKANSGNNASNDDTTTSPDKKEDEKV